MKSNYKRLGSYIQVVNKRNKKLKIKNLIGLSIQKIFIPSISNTIGTDMSTYRIVRRYQFAYCPVTSRNGNKITIALSEEYEEAIISQAYTVFEIIDHNKLLPEYLMMWFRRPEFDRYARYMSHGSVREIFGWEEMCNVELPVPDIEKQKAIVKEYNTIVNRIKLNEQLNQKLEETAQAIYKQWFVDFEFPDENGKPYKASGGGMVWNDELGKEIPVGWKGCRYEDVMSFCTGKLNSNAATSNGKYPFFTCSNETFRIDTYSFDTEAVLLAGNNASAIYPLKYFVGKFDVYQRTYVITPSDRCLSHKQMYFSIKNELESFKGVSSGTTTKFLTMKILNDLKIVIANIINAQYFTTLIDPVFNKTLILKREFEQLQTVKDLLLAKIVRG